MKRKVIKFTGDEISYGENTFNVHALVDFFIDKNNSAEETIQKFNLGSISGLYRILKHYNIKKPSIKRAECVKEGCIKKYGVTASSKAESVKKKVKENNLEKYGVEYPSKLSSTKEKIKKTCLEKYGVDNVFKSKKIQRKQKETCLKKYKVDNAFKATEIKNKIDEYYQNTFNCTHNEYIFNKMKENNSFGKSDEEEYFYNKLLEIFGKEDIIRQYKSKVYPFNCDFYIKSLNAYVELNLHWTHGGHLFTGTEEDNIQLNRWKEKAKTSAFYVNAINVWTRADVTKCKMAKENNLNYFCVYGKREMEDLLTQLLKLNNAKLNEIH